MPQKLNQQSASMRVCIDRVNQSDVVGRVYSQRLVEPLSFSDLGGFALQLEQLMDAQHYPQAFKRIRTFKEEDELVRIGNDLPDNAMSAETVSAAKGERLSFQLYILTRQNATWQGRIDWLDGAPTATFQSLLDFFKQLEARISAT